MESKKLKPAKQALADAIHQNGGWIDGAELAWFQGNLAKNECNEIWFGNELSNPKYYPTSKSYHSYFSQVVGKVKAAKFNNWHQCILSRDEYLTAYQEQVKVDINNETGQKVEVEMKSESEMTIKAGDWHKNGELPPVGEVCIFDPTGGECYFNEDELRAQGHQVSIIAHTKYKQSSGSVAVFKWDLDECCGVGSANACSFRPLRTERDKAIDEMMEHCDYLGSRDFAGKLFDEGFRKEVK